MPLVGARGPWALLPLLPTVRQRDGAEKMKGSSVAKKNEENVDASAELAAALGAEVVETSETDGEVVEGVTMDDIAALNPWEDVEEGFASSELLNMGSVEDLEAAFAAKGIKGSEGEEIQTGYENPLEKSELVGVPFIFVDWKFTQSRQIVENEETGKPEVQVTTFVFARVMTNDGRKGYFTDGSGYGVFDQLMRVSRSRNASKQDGVHPAKFLKAPKGLGEKQNRRGKPTYTIAHLN